MNRKEKNMKYRELRNAHQQEVNNFPLAFAFSDKQFAEGMKKLGLTENDTDKVVSIGGGGFMRKTDSAAFKEMFERHAREMEEAFKDDQFAYDAFMYELGNHEFCITYEYDATLSALGLTEDDLSANDARLARILIRAKNDYLKWVDGDEEDEESEVS